VSKDALHEVCGRTGKSWLFFFTFFAFFVRLFEFMEDLKMERGVGKRWCVVVDKSC
jgi:hypothetical protein